MVALVLPPPAVATECGTQDPETGAPLRGVVTLNGDEAVTGFTSATSGADGRAARRRVEVRVNRRVVC
ncbi:MAG: hypothetical protein WKF96_11885 [Solirubrobacteraceae bacterium]